MKRIVFITCGCACLFGMVLMAQQEGMSRRQEETLKKTGGQIYAPVKGPAILVCNMQKRAPHATVTNIFATARSIVNLPFKVDVMDPPQPDVNPLTLVKKAMSAPDFRSAIIIVDIPEWPTLWVAPEASWAIVNVAPLHEGADRDQFERRVKQELWRGICYALGAGDSHVEKCVMNFVSKPSELDALGLTSYPEYLNKMLRHAKQVGIEPQRPVTYRKAVEEGWAPPPQDKYQQAIWDELKAEKK